MSTDPVTDLAVDPVLEVRDLTGPAGSPVVRGVNLVVGREETRLLLGPIHSGKSMVMRLILGLDRAAHGTIIIDGEPFDAAGMPDAVLRRMRTRIGAVFEGSALVTRISAVENVELPLLEHTAASPAEAREAARELLAEVGVTAEALATPDQLGRAERRRVALARALALRPPVLLLDEPTHGLDPHAAAELDETIAGLQRRHGFGTLIFSHEVRHAFGRIAQIYVMAGGVIVAAGDRAELEHSAQPVARQLLHRRGAP